LSDEERLAHARELLSSVFGEGIADWDPRIADAPPGTPRVACAMPRELISGVVAACTAHGGRLLSLQPQLIDAYAAWRHSLPQSQAWFVTIEEGSLAAARLSSSGWDRVHSLRLGVDWARELRRLQTFGRLASSRPEEGRVYVDAPHSWRGGAGGLVHGADLNGLQWLEEPNTAVTTLARLGRARRLAA
jgi:L-alanine-DL-glutamate epimerase-like enolase superfamily enzyme